MRGLKAVIVEHTRTRTSSSGGEAVSARLCSGTGAPFVLSLGLRSRPSIASHFGIHTGREDRWKKIKKGVLYKVIFCPLNVWFCVSQGATDNRTAAAASFGAKVLGRPP